jgi:phenylalanyl-tRNA synthetase beta chain
LGSIDTRVLKSWKLPSEVTVAEVSLGCLLEQSRLVPQQRSVSMFPSIQRDLNFVVAESVQWRDLERVVRSAVGTDLTELTYRETYRDPNKDGRDRKRVLMTVELQRHDTTLSGSQADELVHRVIEACRSQLSAELLAS